MKKAIFRISKILYPYAFLVVTLALLLRPSSAKGHLAAATKPVEQGLLMSLQHLGHLLHWLEPRPHGALAPIIQELAGPSALL
jgi:hypothetical protein